MRLARLIPVLAASISLVACAAAGDTVDGAAAPENHGPADQDTSPYGAADADPIPIVSVGDAVTVERDAAGGTSVIDVTLVGFTCGLDHAIYSEYDPIDQIDRSSEVPASDGHEFCLAQFSATNTGDIAANNLPWPRTIWVSESESVLSNADDDWVNLNAKTDAFYPGVDVEPGESFQYPVWISLPEGTIPRAVTLTPSQYVREDVAVYVMD